ncbi:MAG: aspartate aminotransferase family protein [Beggiatoa sp. IS2]|nr:MAG: aspartate aminotransferase family protein [Beggiatoa sp. IS2]
MLESKSLSILLEALEHLDHGFAQLPLYQPATDLAALKQGLFEVAERMHDNFPYPHPFYIGQMLKPPHAIARLAYMLSIYINPNNHALDGGRASSAMEKEAVAEIATMFGWQTHLGHLCGGGTLANFEALWIAKSLRPGQTIVASEQSHYTHRRLSQVLDVPFQAIPCNRQAQMDIAALEKVLQTESVGTVVATTGTTGTGSVDPVPEILNLREKYGFRLHIDAAYGGYFRLANNLSPKTRLAFDLITQADSIVIDPHKHGLQPYGCGCVLFKDPQVGVLYKHDSPYTYFSSADLHLGEISLECSRAGSSAVALWATQRLFPLVENGEFARNLEKCRQAALILFSRIQQEDSLVALMEPELDIVVWCQKGKSASQISEMTQRTFHIAGTKGLHLAIAKFPRSILESYLPGITWDEDNIACFRSCVMKPEHLDWLDQIWTIFKESTV